MGITPARIAALLKNPPTICDNADSFPRPTETFYGQTKPAQSEKGVGQWLGFSNLASAAMLAVVANTTDENTKTNVKKVMIGVSLAGALIAKNQVDEFGFDKKQSDMAIGANLALAAVAARDVFGEKK